MPDSWDNYQPATRAMTFEDWYVYYERIARELWVNEQVPFNALTTIQIWDCNSLDEFPSTLENRLFYERIFRMRIPEDVWNGLFSDWETTTIGEICAVLAACGGRVPIIEPLRVMNRQCHEAGAFLALRSELSRLGVDVHTVAPSTSFDGFARSNAKMTHAAIALFDSELADQCEIKGNWLEKISAILGCLGCVGLFGFAAAAIVVTELAVGVWGSITAIGLMYVFGYLSCRFPPRSVKLKGVETIADLCRLLAKGRGEPVS